MPDQVHPETQLRAFLLALELGQMEVGQDLDLLKLLADHPELRPEYLEFTQLVALQHQYFNRFDGKDHLGEVEALMKKQMDMGLNEAEEGQLLNCLTKSERARAYYIESCQVEAMLKQSLGGMIHDTEFKTKINSDRVLLHSRRFQNPWRVALLAASVLLVIETLFFLWFLQSDYKGEKVQTKAVNKVVSDQTRTATLRAEALVTIEDSRGARLKQENDQVTTIHSGDSLRGGSFELLDGLMKLVFENGAEVVMEAPTKFQLLSSKRMKLAYGKISANVPQTAIGFLIDTPTSEVVDLGTAFAVEVDHLGRDEVHVFEGEVVVQSKQGSQSEKLHLYENEAMRIDLATHTPSNIDIDHSRFLRQTQEEVSAYSRQMLKMDPLFYLNMAPGHDGLSLMDLTGHGHHAQAVNYKSSQPNWAPGVFGMAAEFDGPGTQWGYIIPNFKKIESESFTVMAWIYARSRPQWASIAKNWFLDKGQFHFGLLQMTGKLEGHIYVPDQDREIFVEDDQVLPLNCWHHVALSAGNGELSLYRNGVVVDRQAIPALYYNPEIDWISIGAKLNIGKETVTPNDEKFVIKNLEHIKGSFWDGMIDEFGLFDRVLSDLDVQMLYEVGLESLKRTN